MTKRTATMMARVVRLRGEGLTYARISRRLGISAGWECELARMYRRQREGAALVRLIQAGALLSNAAYNLYQRANLLPPETKAKLDELRREWDAARDELREARKAP